MWRYGASLHDSLGGLSEQTAEARVGTLSDCNWLVTVEDVLFLNVESQRSISKKGLFCMMNYLFICCHDNVKGPQNGQEHE